MQAAQEAQWRKNDDSDSSSNEPTTENNYFSDDSDGTSDAEEETPDANSSENQHSLYNSYFPAVQTTVEKPIENEQASTLASNDFLHGQVFQNYLAPVVKIHREQSKIALSNQLVALTSAWDIGSSTDSHVLRFDSRRDANVSTSPNVLQAPLSPLRQRKYQNAVVFQYDLLTIVKPYLAIRQL